MRNPIFSFISHKAGGNLHFSMWEIAVVIAGFLLGNEFIHLFAGIAIMVLAGASMLALRKKSNDRIDHLEILARHIVKKRKMNVCERDEQARPFPYKL